MLLRVQGNDGYKLEHHATRKSDYMIAKSDFCRFLENHTPTQSTFKSGILIFRKFGDGHKNGAFEALKCRVVLKLTGRVQKDIGNDCE